MSATSVVRCSCGWKVGNVARARAFEEAADVEAALVAAEVPRMIRHWKLGHRLTAKREFLAPIVASARRYVTEQEPREELDP